MHHQKISARMRERKRMAFAYQIKSIGSDGRFAGYASVFDIVDNQKDIMLKGAFASAVKTRAGTVKLLWQHQQDEPIGVIDKMFEDSFGLYVEGSLLLDVQRAKEAYTLLKSGAISGLSIGYSPVRYKIDPETGVRLLAEVELFEISLVTFPANQSATVTVVKGTPSPVGGGPGWGRSRQDNQSQNKNAPHLTSPLWVEELRAAELVPLADALDRAILTLRV